MATNNKTIPIPGRLHSVASDGVVTGADEIFDDTKQKFLNVINQEVDQALSDFDESIDSLGDSVDNLSSSVSSLEEAVGSGGSIDSRIESAVNTEKLRAENAETAFDNRIDTLEETIGSGGSIDIRIQNVRDEILNLKGANNGIASLDNSGKVPSSQLPSMDYVPNSQKGTANGVATLDSGGKVPSGQLPSYVDDVLEYNNRAAFPATGEEGKIYVAKDTNISYRWSGSTYIAISNPYTPDEEDLTVTNNVIKFKNRPTTDGMGRIILRKGISLSQQMTQQNTIYVIQYNFTLDANLTVPANCVLDFQGGSISGNNNTYTLTGNNTLISYNSYNILKGLKVAGTFRNDSIVVDIFDDDDWAVKASKANKMCLHIVMVPNSSYECKSTFIFDKSRTFIDGNNALIDVSCPNFMETYDTIHIGCIKDLYIRSISDTPGTCIYFKGYYGPIAQDPQIRDFSVDNLKIDGFDIGIRACSLRIHSQITRCHVRTRIGYWHEGKSAEVSINNSMFYPKDGTETSYGIYVYSDDGISRPEGLYVSDCTITYFKIPIYLASACLDFHVSNCWIEALNRSDYAIRADPKSVNNVETSEVYVTSCTCYGRIMLGNEGAATVNRVHIANSSILTSGMFPIDIHRAQNVTIDSCTVESSMTGDYVPAINITDLAYFVIISNLWLWGFTHGLMTNNSLNGVSLSNIRSNKASLGWYWLGAGVTVIKCTNAADSPMLNEIRRVDGVAKYWDGSAWQAM